MIYNSIHKQYRIGLGLYFKLQYGHKDHPKGWTCISNIPELDLKKLDTQFKDEAVSMVWDLIADGLYLIWSDAAVEASMPKTLPRIRAGRKGIKVQRDLASLQNTVQP